MLTLTLLMFLCEKDIALLQEQVTNAGYSSMATARIFDCYRLNNDGGGTV